jgi:hypothetical protein
MMRYILSIAVVGIQRKDFAEEEVVRTAVVQMPVVA